jgi:hypothetical protein
MTAWCLVGCAATASAQTTRYGPLALRLPASARTLAMADIGIASRDDDVIFYNPAQLVNARGTSMSFERMTADVFGGTMSTVLRFGSGGLGFGINYLEYRQDFFAAYPISRDDILHSSPSASSGESMLAALGYAQTYHGFRVGAAANYAVDQIGTDRFRNVVGDVGVSHDFFNRLTTGLSLQHLGGPLGGNCEGDPANLRCAVFSSTPSKIQSPAKATLGAGWSQQLGPLDVVATTAVSAVREGHVSPAVGGEASWSWLSGYAISARGGVRYPRGVADSKYTAGVGFVADRLSIDLAAEVMSNDGVGYRAGFRIR